MKQNNNTKSKTQPGKHQNTKQHKEQTLNKQQHNIKRKTNTHTKTSNAKQDNN